MTILSTINDAHLLTRTVVIIDVFRSSNTIIELLFRGVRQVVPVLSVEAALDLRSLHPDWLIFGEKNGVKVPGFDGDNSPSQSGHNVKDRTIVLMTSGGTRCIMACDHSRDVIIASFANAGAVINHLRLSEDVDPVFWAVGTKARHPALEDELCAEFMEELFMGKEVDFTAIKPRLLQCPGALRLEELGHSDDLEFCARLNTRNVVPILFKKTWGSSWNENLISIQKK